MKRIMFVLLLAACGGDEPDTGRFQAPAAGAQLMGVEMTSLTPGVDTAQLVIRDPYAADKVALAEGKLYFDQFNCSGCHAPLGGGGMGPPLSDTLWIYGGEPGNIYLSIVQGRPNGMPAWQSLPPDVVWKLVSYIRTLPEEKRKVASGTQ